MVSLVTLVLLAKLDLLATGLLQAFLMIVPQSN